MRAGASESSHTASKSVGRKRSYTRCCSSALQEGEGEGAQGGEEGCDIALQRGGVIRAEPNGGQHRNPVIPQRQRMIRPLTRIIPLKAHTQ